MDRDGFDLISAHGEVESIAQLPLGADSRAMPVPAVPAVSNPWVLKRLTQVHKDAITLSMQGLSRDKVAEYCGRTPAWVTMVCKQPLARAYIADLEAHADLRLRGLYERSIDAIRDGLNSPRVSDKLAAAQIQLKAIGKGEPGPDDGKQTAEDIVGAMLIQGNTVQVNVTNRR